jgi:hypothetical protein
MPICGHCGRYYTKSAMWCPSCFTDGGQPKPIIQATVELPSVGDIYRDPVVGDVQMITSLHWTAEASLVLELEDGSSVEIEPSALVPLPASVARVEAQ